MLSQHRLDELVRTAGYGSGEVNGSGWSNMSGHGSGSSVGDGDDRFRGAGCMAALTTSRDDTVNGMGDGGAGGTGGYPDATGDGSGDATGTGNGTFDLTGSGYVDRIPVHLRQLLEMHYGLGAYHYPHSVADIAATLHCSTQLVDLMLVAGLEMLRTKDTLTQLSDVADWEI